MTSPAEDASVVGQRDTRPWGSWEILAGGPGYQVKRITVSAQQRLSYQTHERRAEHWTVAAGVATCTVDGAVTSLAIGESLDIAVGQPHRLANGGEDPLVIIEVQLGDYLGEDDIIRLEDDYDRG